MSNSLAIATVTETIRGLISNAGIKATAQTPDKVIPVGERGGVNLFLFHAMPNAAWRNMDLPGQVRTGERGFPPLALNLHYLLTGYGTDGDIGDLFAQQVLGEAMRVLHDRPELSSDDIRNFAQGALANTDLDEQIERVRISHDPLSHEDLFRMWATFNTPYRVSAAYQASVVLIESQRPTKSPLPVLQRGRQDRGVLTRLDADPTLMRVEYRDSVDRPAVPAAKVGDTVRLIGTDFPRTGLEVLIRDSRRDQILDQSDGDVVARLIPERLSNTELRATLSGDDQSNEWTSGMLAVELRFPSRDDASGSATQRSTNAVPLAVSPRLRMQSTGVSKERVSFTRTDLRGRTLLTLTVEELIEKSRRVFLILSEVGPDDPASDEVSGTLRFYQLRQESGSGAFTPTFDVGSVEPGRYWLRLRVDGVDSQIMKRVRLDTDPVGTPDEDGSGFEFDKRFQIEL